MKAMIAKEIYNFKSCDFSNQDHYYAFRFTVGFFKGGERDES